MIIYSNYGCLVSHRGEYPTQIRGRDTRETGTHIETLEDNTPKSRRRVRNIRGLPNTCDVNIADIDIAQEKAYKRELAGAVADAAKRRAKP